MNELKDNDLREALRRMEERRTPAKVPFDFCDKVMQEIEPKRKKRGKTVATFLAIAASFSLALLMVLPHEKNDEKHRISLRLLLELNLILFLLVLIHS